MPSKVSICNQALGWLGANLIVSFEDEITESDLCKANYDPLRRTVLEEGPWSFAISRVQLNEVVGAPVYEYDYTYQLPTDLIRVIEVSDPTAEIRDWVKEGDKILCNYSTVFIKYIKNEENVAIFSSGFIQALAARIAMDLAAPITKSKTVVGMMTDLYEMKLATAESLDGLQGINQKITSDRLKRPR